MPNYDTETNELHSRYAREAVALTNKLRLAIKTGTPSVDEDEISAGLENASTSRNEAVFRELNMAVNDHRAHNRDSV